MKIQGIVVEVGKQSVTLLTSDGAFRKCPKPLRQVEIGDEVHLDPPRSISMGAFPRIAVVAAVFALLFLTVLYPFFTRYEAYAIFTIDINPSLELSVTDEWEVIEVSANNLDGEKVLKQLGGVEEWQGETVEKLLRQITETTEALGYVEDATATDLIVSERFVDPSESPSSAWQNEEEGVKTQLESLGFRVYWYESEEEVSELAKKEGVSVGRYLYNKEQEDDEKKREQEEKEQEQTEEDVSIDEATISENVSIPSSSGQNEESSTPPVTKDDDDKNTEKIGPPEKEKARNKKAPPDKLKEDKGNGRGIEKPRPPTQPNVSNDGDRGRDRDDDKDDDRDGDDNRDRERDRDRDDHNRGSDRDDKDDDRDDEDEN
nr:anti-sigma factor domain-containing protein [Bacillus fonticola]